MIRRMVDLALRQPMAVALLTLLACVLGLWGVGGQTIEAYPDISANMVQIVTQYPGKAAEDVERQVTIPIENVLMGASRVRAVRSRTIFGLSLVQLIFEDGSDLFFARQRVAEKLGEASLPQGVVPVLAPPTTAFGEIYRYELANDGTQALTKCREIQDWVVIPALMRVPGVADCVNFGGFQPQLIVTFFPAQLDRFGLALSEVYDAIRKNNASAGGSVIDRGGESVVVRSGGLIENPDQLANIFVKSVGGAPIYIKDIASVGWGNAIPAGVFSKDLRAPGVGGAVLMRRGENPSEVLGRIEAAVQDLNEGGDLPEGLRIEPYYNRQFLVEATWETVVRGGAWGTLAIFFILWVYFGDAYLGVMVGLAIPVALLCALTIQRFLGVPVSLMTLGALGPGILVAAPAMVADRMVRPWGGSSLAPDRLTAFGPRDQARLRILTQAVTDAFGPLLIWGLAVVVSLSPLWALSSIEGILFRPMVLTFGLAFGVSLVWAILVLPVALSWRGGIGCHGFTRALEGVVCRFYTRVVGACVRCRWLVLGLAGCLVVHGALRVAPKLGSEYLPTLNEGVLWVRANFPEGSSLEQTHIYGRRLREIALGFPEVDFAVAQVGRNDNGTDPFPPSRIEMMIGPSQRGFGNARDARERFVAALGQAFRGEFPTTRFNFTQPIIDSVTEDSLGTSAQLALEFSGPDLEMLGDLARKSAAMLRDIPGAVDVNIEQEGPQPQLVIQPDRQLCARYNIRIDDVSQLVDMAIGGEPVGILHRDGERLDIVCQFDRSLTDSIESFRRFPVYSGDSQPIPLAQIASVQTRDGPTLIAREAGRRRLTVRCDIQGRDQGGFAREAMAAFETRIAPSLPHGYEAKWVGMFSHLERAWGQFALFLPVCLGLILLLGAIGFGSLGLGAIAVVGVPFAYLGGLWAMGWQGIPLSVASGVGLCALTGFSALFGILLVDGIRQARRSGLPMPCAILSGATDRFRVVLLVGLMGWFGSLPSSMSQGLGSDLQRPLASVIAWGMVSAALASLVVVPVLFHLVEPFLSLQTPNRARHQPEPG